MLGTPNGRASKSKLPSTLLVLALVAGGSYFFFFRPKPAAAPLASVPAAPALPARTTDIAGYQKAFSESLAAAPVLAPAKPLPKATPWLIWVSLLSRRSSHTNNNMLPTANTEPGKA